MATVKQMFSAVIEEILAQQVSEQVKTLVSTVKQLIAQQYPTAQDLEASVRQAVGNLVREIAQQVVLSLLGVKRSRWNHQAVEFSADDMEKLVARFAPEIDCTIKETDVAQMIRGQLDQEVSRYLKGREFRTSLKETVRYQIERQFEETLLREVKQQGLGDLEIEEHWNEDVVAKKKGG